MNILLKIITFTLISYSHSFAIAVNITVENLPLIIIQSNDTKIANFDTQFPNDVIKVEVNTNKN